jgi:hypothetical protein
MNTKQTNSLRPSPVRRWTAVVCLLLVGIAIGAEAFHVHPHDPLSDAKHCATCQVAHAPAQVAPVAHLDVVLTDAAFHSLSENPDPKQGSDAFALFCRPPPVIE